jgi:hypothetical protein
MLERVWTQIDPIKRNTLAVSDEIVMNMYGLSLTKLLGLTENDKLTYMGRPYQVCQSVKSIYHSKKPRPRIYCGQAATKQAHFHQYKVTIIERYCDGGRNVAAV